MKRFFNIFLLFFGAIGLYSCHDLDVPVTTQLTPDVFPQTTAQFVQAAGPTYNSFRQSFLTDYWFLQSLSTDEAILPARGGNWYDGGVMNNTTNTLGIVIMHTFKVLGTGLLQPFQSVTKISI
jgi:hypothetical protein